MVGMVVTTSPSLSLYRMVVLPAASRPTMRMRISCTKPKPRAAESMSENYSSDRNSSPKAAAHLLAEHARPDLSERRAHVDKRIEQRRRLATLNEFWEVELCASPCVCARNSARQIEFTKSLSFNRSSLGAMGYLSSHVTFGAMAARHGLPHAPTGITTILSASHHTRYVLLCACCDACHLR